MSYEARSLSGEDGLPADRATIWNKICGVLLALLKKTQDEDDVTAMSQQDRRAGPDRSSGQSSRLDSFFYATFLAALVLLAFLAGAVLTAGSIFPGPEIARAYQGGKALYEKLTAYQDVYASDLWYSARRPDRGVTVHLPARAQEGVTLYTSGHEAVAFLISMDGRVLHEWRRPFSTVWNASAGIKKPRPDSHVYFRKARVYPNGDLLAIYEGVGDTPYGYGLVKLNRDSEVIWSYFGRAHHDFDIGPGDRIYALTHEIVDERLPSFDNLSAPRLDDFLVMLSPDGEEIKKISLIHVVAKSPYQHLLHTVSSYAVGDPLHANAVSVITDEVAANFPYGKPGQILVSFRELGAIGVLDLDREELVWAARAYWIGQHDPDILPNGNILLFDNYGHFGMPEGASRVIEFNPRTMEIVWQYAGTPDRPFDSQIRSSQERLPNGNTLITESNGGRILEVTPEGEIAWEFVNPVGGGEGGKMIPIIGWAQRLDPAGLDPALLRPDQLSQQSIKEPPS